MSGPKCRTPTLFSFFLAAAMACGSEDVELAGDGGAAADATPGTTIDADPASGADAGTWGGPCTPQGAACNNCVDDDGDGKIDGDDPECTGAIDDDESSFATGISGDNKDAVKQDCFFDGNSGAGGEDGCDIHVCCMLEPFVDCCEQGENPTDDGCVDFTGPTFDPAECTVTQECVDNCGVLTPPGCDCFGCCTVCDESGCSDIYTNPGIYENETCAGIDSPAEGECCDAENLDACYQCTKIDECGEGSCNDDPEDCLLCPGQDESDLPDTCDMQECPVGATLCGTSADCPGDDYCSNGCCIAVID